MADQDLAEALHQQAMALHDQGEEEQALQAYHRALELDWARPETHYNIGLIHKYRGEWEASLKHNQYAVQFDPEDEASNWNLAIAATALRDWRTAREAWQRLGMKIEAGDTPDDQTLRAAMSHDLAAYKQPRTIIRVAAMPRHASGKSDYRSGMEIARARIGTAASTG